MYLKERKQYVRIIRPFEGSCKEIIIRLGLELMLFADNTQLYIAFKQRSDDQPRIEAYIDEIRACMRHNLLVLDDSKTIVIHIT